LKGDLAMLNFKGLSFIIKFILAVNLLICCFYFIGCGISTKTASVLNETKQADAENEIKTSVPISLFDDQVSFVPPADFKALTIDKLKKKLPENDLPGHIFSNSEQTGLVLVYILELDDKPIDFGEVKNFVEKTHRNYSGWITSEITEINGKQWFHFDWKEPEKNDSELVSPVPPEGEAPTFDNIPSHYQEYTTALGNKLLRFVFEADVKEYEHFKNAFTESSRTIQIKK
jgi:hypothetical protein